MLRQAPDLMLTRQGDSLHIHRWEKEMTYAMMGPGYNEKKARGPPAYL